jgi:hypothetical protein
MSNNKQSMKLYTEAEIKRGLDNPISFDMTTDEFINSLTPIEFPSYDDIKDESTKHSEVTMSNDKQTPKEKAEELLDKMTMEIGKFNAKQCALIAVDELIRIAPWGSDIDGEIEDDSKEYYIEVKQEIENYKQ